MGNFIPFRNVSLPEKSVSFGKILPGQLINMLNHINFEERTINVVFKHKRHKYSVILRAKPEPCRGGKVACTWAEATSMGKLQSYEFSHFLIDNRKDLFLVTPVVERLAEDGLIFNVQSSTCIKVGFRNVKRIACVGVEAQLIQNGICFNGMVIDHNAFSFCVKVPKSQTSRFKFINPEVPLMVVMRSDEGVVFSGDCDIFRQTRNRNHAFFIVKPRQDSISRFRPKKFRSQRTVLAPLPMAFFKSPLAPENVNLNIEDISGTGFSVVEDSDKSSLFPGLIISGLEITFSSQASINCSAQVVYREFSDNGHHAAPIRYGFTFLDMDMNDQVVLASILSGQKHRNTYVCNRVSTDDLWDFFFESGFLYPEKYLSIHEKKKLFKDTCEKLYGTGNDIARHFVYQEKGIIHSHLSMVRFYEKSWLIQHHMSKSASLRRVGLQVLEQAGKYINDFHALAATNMDYVMCYFRPENRFPSRVFGGCAATINDKKACSVDSFAYFFFKRNAMERRKKQTSVEISESTVEDLEDLEMFYDHYSGGLMLNALGLEPEMKQDALSADYRRRGFRRERRVFSLYKKNSLKAVLMVNVSDLGLNLSSLTNCIHTYIIDPDGLDRSDLYTAYSHLCSFYEREDQVPVLLFPADIAEEKSIPVKRTYTLWVLSMQHTERYFAYLDGLFQRQGKKDVLSLSDGC